METFCVLRFPFFLSFFLSLFVLCIVCGIYFLVSFHMVYKIKKTPDGMVTEMVANYIKILPVCVSSRFVAYILYYIQYTLII